MAEDLALAGLGQDDEFVAQIAADGAGVGPHGHRLQAEAGEGVQIGHEHAVVGSAGGSLVDIEGIGVLHQELPPAHHPEPGAALVAELPLDVVEVLRQVLVALHVGPEDFGDHLFGGGPIEQVALVAVGDAQHLVAIIVIAPALAPQVGQLQGGHQHLDGAGPVHFLADDLLDLLQDPKAERQPGIDSRRFLTDHSGAQHQLVRGDLGVGGRLTQRGNEITRKTHAFGAFVPDSSE